MQKEGLLTALIRPFYKGALTYWLSYWYGTIGTVTLGPDRLHFHIMFALRPTPSGGAEGQTILITKQRLGFWRGLLNGVLLEITRIVGNYFARGDTQIFRSIKFKLATPISEDAAIIRFIEHAEKQPLALQWGDAQ